MNATAGTEIRVAQGTYKPDQSDFFNDKIWLGNRGNSFELKSDVVIKGGFAGLSSTIPDRRDPSKYETILSGDLNSDDADMETSELYRELSRIENSYNIVTGSGVDETAVLDGFMITGGNANVKYYRERGGGLYVLNGSPRITGCIFTENSADTGGAIYSYDETGKSNLKLENCVFVRNFGSGGAGCFVRGIDLVLNNCIFHSNFSDDEGGAIYSRDGNLKLSNSTLSGNYADSSGGGIYVRGGNVEFVNSILWANECDDLTGELVQIRISYPLSVIINYCCIEDWSGRWGGNGNIGSDPCFANFEAGDFHLMSQGGRWEDCTWVIDEVTSPCIDAGCVSDPVGLEPFANGGRGNIGAYGCTEQASKSYFGKVPCETIMAGDINGDCKVDFADIAILSNNWLWNK